MSNCVREMSKVMMKPGKDHFDSLLRAIKFVIDTKNVVVCFKPNVCNKEPWVIETFVDSDWGGDKNTRKSVTVWCVFINDCLIRWGSKGQNGVVFHLQKLSILRYQRL